VAGLFRVFGARLAVERAVGFAFRLLLVVGLFVCLRRFGELPALTGGVLAACLVAADGVNADNRVTARALVRRAIAAEARLARPGGRLFVGPRALRRTAGNYLLPQQRPASFYVELDPVASRAGSGLADDLRQADVLLLGGPWEALHEPNASSHDGSRAANEVVARLFCRGRRFGTYELFARCG
jgi:hypothetical protein